MIDENVTEITKEVIKTEPINRPWVLSLIINVILFGGMLYSIDLAKTANEEKVEASRKYDILVSSTVTDSKASSVATTLLIKEVNDAWQKKYDLLLLECRKDHDALTEKRIQELKVKSEMILQETKRMTKQMNKQINK